MGKITITAYGKVLYDRELPDKLCFAVTKEREIKDKEFEEKIKEVKQ